MELIVLEHIADKLKDNNDIDCVGVIFIGDICKEVKVYRFEKRSPDGTTIEKYATAKNKNNSRRYFRIIPCETINYSAIINRFATNEHIPDNARDTMFGMCQIASKKKNLTRIRLSQLGVQDSFFEGRIIKSYFSIRKFFSVADVKGEKQRFSEINDIFSEIRKVCLLSDDYYNLVSGFAEKFEQYGYYASLIGLNQKGDKLEFKTYFELFSPDLFFTDIEEHTTKIINCICSKYSISKAEFNEINTFFIKTDYFLRGVAISNNYGDDKLISIRLYFAPMQRFV